MSESQAQPPFFQGVEPRVWTPNRLYRIYIRPSELILIRAGSAGEVGAIVGAQFGLLGALVAAAANPAKKNENRQAEMNNTAFDNLIDDHRHNFRVAVEEIEAASLDPASFWLAVWYHQPQHVGVLHLKYPGRGQIRIAIPSTDDLKKAFETLPSLLGERLTVNVEWSEKKNRFVRKR